MQRAGRPLRGLADERRGSYSGDSRPTRNERAAPIPTTAGRVAWQWCSRSPGESRRYRTLCLIPRRSALTAETQRFHHPDVFPRALPPEIAEEAPASTDHLEEPPTRGEILPVRLEVLGQFQDLVGEGCYLNLSGADVLCMGSIGLDKFSLRLRCEWHARFRSPSFSNSFRLACVQYTRPQARSPARSREPQGAPAEPWANMLHWPHVRSPYGDAATESTIRVV